MSVFGIFISPQEYKFKELLKNKPNLLMYTSKTNLKENSILKISSNEELKKDVVIATSNEKIAHLHLLDPFFSFTFGSGEYGAIILGDYHNLLKLDKESANIYSLDADKFYPIVGKKGDFEGKWYSEEDVMYRVDIPPKKIKFVDVLKNGIQVFWINSMETLKQIDEEMNDLGIKTGEQKLEYLMNQTNWKSDKVVYMNKYKNICPVKEKDGAYKIEHYKAHNKRENKVND